MSGTFATTVRAARQHKRLRLREVAQALGFSVPHVSDIERGNRRPPDSAKVRCLAELLDLDPNELVTIAARERGGECGHGVLLEAAARLFKASDRLTECISEFGSDAPMACGTYLEELIDAEDAYRAVARLP